MYNEYGELYDDNIAFERFNPQSRELLKAQVRKRSKTAGGLSLSIATTAASIPVIGSIPTLLAAYSTHGHINRLEKMKLQNLSCCCSENFITCEQILDYAIAQKTKKKRRALTKAVPVVGMMQTVYEKVHHYTKSDVGETRTLFATYLMLKVRGGDGLGSCQLAKAIACELLSCTYNKLTTKLDSQEAIQILAYKLASN
ncbi:MAG: hypothetical protein AAFZ92_06965 [Pseudomonadota bacterium]